MAESESKYTNLDLGMLTKCGIIRGTTVIERAMISSVMKEIAELADASSKDLCMTFERVRQLADGSFLGVSLDSPDTRHTTDDLRGKECIRIYVCEDGETIQEFNLIISYKGMVSLIGDFHGFVKFTLKKFENSESEEAPQVEALHNVDEDYEPNITIGGMN